MSVMPCCHSVLAYSGAGSTLPTNELTTYSGSVSLLSEERSTSSLQTIADAARLELTNGLGEPRPARLVRPSAAAGIICRDAAAVPRVVASTPPGALGDLCIRRALFTRASSKKNFPRRQQPVSRGIEPQNEVVGAVHLSREKIQLLGELRLVDDVGPADGVDAQRRHDRLEAVMRYF